MQGLWPPLRTPARDSGGAL